MSSQVTVQQGSLQGKICTSYDGKKYYSFEGIPYAKPPVGKLRFKDPQDLESWIGVQDATKPGNRCAQINLNTMSMEGSEDCLYLNVYTPSLPHEKIQKLPVLFFVHGGRYLVGYGDWYQPDYLIKNDVILVTINYRLHILGFLCLDLPEAPGNACLKDCTKALEWVNKNISNFNGDSRNITVMGESAGAGVITSFLTSDMTNGLFDKAIAQSGNCIADVYASYEDHIDKAKHLASLLGRDCSDTRSLYDFFVDVPIDELVSTYFSFELSRPPYVVGPYLTPVVEKQYDGVQRFFYEFPIDTMKRNGHRKVPILLGFSMHEGGLFIRKDGDGNIIYENDFSYYVPKYLQLDKGNEKSKKIERKIRDYYFKGKQIDDSMKLDYLNLVSDSFFNRDLNMFPEMLSKHQDDVFLYYFSYVGNLNISVMKNLGIKGTTHGDIIQYEFYRSNKHDRATEKDREVINFLSEVWCNFCKNGKPTWSNQQVTWQPYKQSTRLCLDINEKKKLIPNPQYEMYKFWAEICQERSKL